MIIKLTVTETPEPEKSLEDQFRCRSSFPDVAFSNWDKDRAINHVKGACLHCLAEFEQVPDAIMFFTEVAAVKGGKDG